MRKFAICYLSSDPSPRLRGENDGIDFAWNRYRNLNLSITMSARKKAKLGLFVQRDSSRESSDQGQSRRLGGILAKPGSGLQSRKQSGLAEYSVEPPK
jgi:hypothetical protein